MKAVLALLAALFLVLTCACACSRRDSRPGEEAVVVGTVLDAATGLPAPGVRLEGPQGASAVSGENGRFEMEGLRAGDSGEILAKASDGRRGGVTLLPLAPGRLEVVVQLYRR
jgi:hypothetical protein